MQSPSTDRDDAGRLARVLGRLRRSLNREVRAGSADGPLPEAQLEILRLVKHRPGLRIHDAAAELRLAPNTVSTLVHRLTEEGLLELQPDAADRRVTRLRLSLAAEARMRQWRDRRAEILSARLRGLDAADREAVSKVLPVLDAIAASLERADGG
jgi:DNA-binding MarR family transcriptional regulator